MNTINLIMSTYPRTGMKKFASLYELLLSYIMNSPEKSKALLVLFFEQVIVLSYENQTIYKILSLVDLTPTQIKEIETIIVDSNIKALLLRESSKNLDVHSDSISRLNFYVDEKVRLFHSKNQSIKLNKGLDNIVSVDEESID